MAIDLSQLQLEVGEWSLKNFGDQPSTFPLLGIGEETGELMHAHLKDLQGIRHLPHEIKAMKEDAIGDIVIYLADYCAREGLEFSHCVGETWRKVVRKRNWKENPEDGSNPTGPGGDEANGTD